MEKIIEFIDYNLMRGNIIECASSINADVTKYCETPKDKDVILNYINMIGEVEDVEIDPSKKWILIIHKEKNVTLLRV